MHLKRIGFIGIFCIILLFLGCSGTPRTFDSSLPLERSAILYFMDVEVTEYNGIPVPHRIASTGITVSEWKHIAIPPGIAEFTVDVMASFHFGKDFVFRYNFEAGQDYYIVFDIQDRDWGVKIYKQKYSVFPRSENLLDFVVFQ